MTKISTIVFGLLIVLGGLSGCDVNNNKQNVYAIFPLSGNFAAGGKILTRTIDTYMKVHPKSNISIRYIDSQSDPAKAISAVRQGVLYEKSPIAVLGITSVCSAVLPIISESGGFAFPVCALKSNTASISPCYQFLSYDVEDVAEMPALYMRSKCKTVAIVYSDEDYGRKSKEAFKLKFSGQAGVVLMDVAFSPSSTEVREIIDRIVSSSADGVYIAGVANGAYMNVFRGLKERGFSGEIVTDIVFSSPFIYKTLDSVANGIVCVCCDSDFEVPTTESGSLFRRLCLDNGIDPYYGVVEVYDALSLIDTIVEKNLQFSQDAMIKMNEFKGSACTVRFIHPGESKYNFHLGRISNGKIVPVEW